ncbi:MAG TPA: NADH-quinone oxidoreductase subunit NuoF [Bacillota bacterium]
MRDAEDLEARRAAARAAVDAQKVRFLVCMETACMAMGADRVFEALNEAIAGREALAEVVVLDDRDGDHPGKPVKDGKAGLIKAGCHGYCQAGPLVKIEPGGTFYTHVKPEDARDIVKAALDGGAPIERLLWKDPATGKVCPTEKEMPFYAGQRKVALENCGLIDSEELAEYIAFEGYRAIAKVLNDMTPEQVVAEITASGLRGRGGGGFPTGKKWLFTQQAKGEKKYVVCNGDEGDPGAFMDRSVMEGDPHRVIEGMMIAGYAVGADEGYIYCRAEYPLAVKRLRRAIDQARQAGLLGRNILGHKFSFDINLKEGAGAFVCGEETALLASIEGRRGMPRPRPPFPAIAGLFGKPTLLNNVETYANVPSILRRGGAWFASVGTAKSPGTKTFAVAGQVARTGLIEVPMGIRLRDVLFGIAGGMRNPGRKFKAVQIGGPSGGCLTEQHLDLPLDYESLSSAGAMVGSGGLVVMDEDTCMVETARYFMTFVQNESCGKCVPCREGTKRMQAILTRITDGRGTPEDLDLLQELAVGVKEGALCGLGKTAPNAVLTTMRYFRGEYEAHVLERRCPAGVCKGLKRYQVIAEKCKGCAVCARNCPAGAITGELKKPYTIDSELCTKCGTCQEKCKFGAIEVV